MQRMLVCSHVALTYGKTMILADVGFELKPGDALCIAGASGSGKSSLLRLLVRDGDPTGGTIMVDGAPLAALPGPVLQLYRSRLGVLFQEPLLLARSTVAENIAYPLVLRGTKPNTARKMTLDMLERIGMTAFAHRFPHHLSNGERAMVQLGRALIASPIIVLADEPFTHLDDAQIRIATQLLDEARKGGASLLVLTRAPELATLLSARVLTLKDGKTHETKHARSTKAAKPHHVLEESEEQLEEPTPAVEVTTPVQQAEPQPEPEPLAAAPTKIEEDMVETPHRVRRGGPRHRGEDGKVKITAING